jgi:hypothetical protein
MEASLNTLFEYVASRSAITVSELQTYWTQLTSPKTEVKIEPKTETKTRCIHLMVRGKKEGQPCDAPIKAGTPYCSKHQKAETDKKMIIVEDDEEEKVEVKVPEPVKVVPQVVKVPEPVKNEPEPAKPEPVVKKQEKSTSEKKPAAKKPVVKKEEEFVATQIMTVEDTKKLEFRVTKREYDLNHKEYPAVESDQHGEYVVVKDTLVVLNEGKTEILGYLNEKNELVRTPNRATDRVVIEYGLPFNTEHMSEDDIDE